MKFTLYVGLVGCILTLFSICTLSAQGQEQGSNSNFAPLSFSENKGQWNKAVLYRTDLGGSVVSLRKNGFGFFLLNKEDESKLSDHTHGQYTPKGGGGPHIENSKGSSTPAARQPRPEIKDAPPANTPPVRAHFYTVTFLNAAEAPQIAADKTQDGYANYFLGNDPAKWATEVKSYQRVNYTGLYPGIDMQVYSEASLLKYDLIVQPGADLSRVKLQYDGITGITLKKGQLHVNTSVGEVIEQTPYAYQYINNQRVPVKVSYQLKNNQVSFRLTGDYNDKYPLIIDPTYVFSTLTGAKADNWGFTATYDAQGNFYGGGIIRNREFYPTTPGAIQNAYQGAESDIGITKFSANGDRKSVV